jgi:hypothetical protein
VPSSTGDPACPLAAKRRCAKKKFASQQEHLPSVDRGSPAKHKAKGKVKKAKGKNCGSGIPGMERPKQPGL